MGRVKRDMALSCGRTFNRRYRCWPRLGKRQNLDPSGDSFVDSSQQAACESIRVMEESAWKAYISHPTGVCFVVFNRVAMTSGKAAVLLAAAALVMTPAIGLAAAAKQRPPAISLSFDKISTFTPAGADPRLAAIFAGRAPAIADFKFTPIP